MLAKKTSKDQITLPKKIIKEFENIEYFDITIQEGKIVLIPVTIKPSVLPDIRNKMALLGIKDKDIEDAVNWARTKKAR